MSSLFFFFNDPATTEIYPLSLPAPLPIFCASGFSGARADRPRAPTGDARRAGRKPSPAGSPCIACRSEEHTSELQSRSDLVCRLLLEKKKNKQNHRFNPFLSTTPRSDHVA